MPERESSRLAVSGVLEARKFLPLFQHVNRRIESTARAISPDWIWIAVATANNPESDIAESQTRTAVSRPHNLLYVSVPVVSS